MKLDYNSREIFWGNEALIVADLAKGSNGKPEFTNHCNWFSISWINGRPSGN